MSSLDPALVSNLLELGVAAARWLWHKTHGDDTKPDEAKLREAAMLGAHSQLFRLENEIERTALLAGIPTDALTAATAALLEALRESSRRPGLIASVLDMEEVPAGEPLSPVLDSDHLETKP